MSADRQDRNQATSMATDDHTNARQALRDSLYHDGGLASEMSLLDYFAGQALTTVNPPSIFSLREDRALTARVCYAMADAMIDEKKRLENERR